MPMQAQSSFSTAEVERFRAEVREWVATAVPRRWIERADRPLTPDEEVELRREWDKIIYRAGYAGLTWPTEYGGRGLGPIEEYVFFEECARAHAPDLLDIIGRFVAAPAIIGFGSDEQKRRFVPRILSGDEIWCEGFSEPNAGSDLAAVTTTAVRDGDTYRISGVKVWTSNAHLADRCVLLARTSLTARRHHNLSIFLLDMRQPGVHAVPIRQITDSKDTSQVFFDGAIATAAELLGVEHEGWGFATLAGFRSTRGTFDAARRVFLRESFDQIRDCCRTVGGPWAEVERVETKLDLLRWHGMRATELRAAGRDHAPASAILKVYWSELWQEINELGLSLACPLHEEYWRVRYLEARSATIYGGTAQIQRNVIAERVLGLPR